MTANAFHNIAQIEISLWEAADQLRTNSNLTATKNSMPVLGVIFLRPSSVTIVVRSLEERNSIHRGGGFIKRRALMPPETAR